MIRSLKMCLSGLKVINSTTHREIVSLSFSTAYPIVTQELSTLPHIVMNFSLHFFNFFSWFIHNRPPRTTSVLYHNIFVSVSIFLWAADSNDFPCSPECRMRERKWEKISAEFEGKFCENKILKFSRKSSSGRVHALLKLRMISDRSLGSPKKFLNVKLKTLQ